MNIITMKNILQFFAWFLLLLSTPIHAFSLQEYFPIRPGTIWNYVASNGNYTITVLDQKQYVNGYETTVVVDSDGIKNYYTNNGNGVFLHKTEEPIDGGTGIVEFHPPAKLFEPDATLNNRIISHGIARVTIPGAGVYSLTYTSYYDLINQETISIQSGTYENALHLTQFLGIHGDINGSQVSSSSSSNYWFIKEIGPVKYDNLDDVYTFGELRKITIPQTPSPIVIQRNTTTGANLTYNLFGASVTSQSQINIVADLDWKIAGTGDFNADGEKDLLWRNSTTGENYIYFMNGHTIINNLHVNTISNTDWEVVGIADFDGDGKDDILWRNKTNGSVWMYLMDGATIKNSLHVAFTGLDWEIKGAGDFDGDGKGDILWRNKLYGRVWMYLMDGATIQTSSHVAHSGNDWDIKATGDFNADGKEDLLWRNSQSGINWMYLMNGTQITLDAYVNTLTDLNWEVVNTQDFNGDNRTDVLWRHAITGENLLYQMNGTTIMDARTVGL